MEEKIYPISENIFSDVKTEEYGIDGNCFYFGNTGFFLVRSYSEWSWHFMPDGYSSSLDVRKDISGDVNKFIKAFAYGFYSFYLWYKENNFEKFNKPVILSSNTSLKMANFLTRILSKEYVQIESNIAEECLCTIAIKALFNNEEAMKVIKSFYKLVIDKPIVMETLSKYYNL